MIPRGLSIPNWSQFASLYSYKNLCLLDYDPCFTNPCLNGGSCSENANGGFTCTCTKDFNGKYCGGNLILHHFIEILILTNEAEFSLRRSGKYNCVKISVKICPKI